MRNSFGLCLAALLTVFTASPLHAQNGAWSVTVPSPTAASLGKYGDVPVSLFTGLPDITIPLFTAKGKTIDLPITLAYHASGIKVEELGGWVGLGWSLRAGGVITRTVRGLVDEWGTGYYNTGHAWYDPANSGLVLPQNLLQNMAANFVDGEPDKFFATFAGRTAEFVMGPTSQVPGSEEVRTTPYQDWDIDFTKVGNAIASWVITTEDGTRYTFAAQETHTDRGSSDGPLWNEEYASSWYLTEIRAPGGDVITLSYQSYNVTHDMGEGGEYWVEAGGACSGGPKRATSKYDIVSQRLTTITTAAHIIEFSAGTLRTDALTPGGTPQEPRLDLITVKTRSNVVLRRFQLAYDYSIGSPGRLTLKEVFEQDRNGVALPPHTFSYAGPALPARTSFAVDDWGYFNGPTGAGNASYVPPGTSPNSGLSYTGANRTPHAASMQGGTLTRITYPTGGFSEFIYEPQDYGSSMLGQTAAKKTMAGGLRVAEVRTGDGMGTISIRKYRYTLASETDRSSGMIEVPPKYDYFFFQPSGPNQTPCEYYSRSYRNRLALGNGPTVVYKEVTVLNGANGEFGTSRHAFHVADSPPPIPGSSFPFHRRNSYYWRWGDEIHNQQYDAAGRLQRWVHSVLTFRDDAHTTRQFRGMSFTSWGALQAYSYSPFAVNAAWKHPAGETTTVYDTTGTASFSTSRTLSYGNPAHAQLTEEVVTNSDGTQRITRLKYPADYATGSNNSEAVALTAMQGPAHIHSAVVERTVSEKIGATEKVVQAELTTFRQFLVGQFLPYQRFVLNSPSPIP